MVENTRGYNLCCTEYKFSCLSQNQPFHSIFHRVYDVTIVAVIFLKISRLDTYLRLMKLTIVAFVSLHNFTSNSLLCITELGLKLRWSNQNLRSQPKVHIAKLKWSTCIWFKFNQILQKPYRSFPNALKNRDKKQNCIKRRRCPSVCYSKVEH